LLAPFLLDVNTSDDLVAVPHRLESTMQILKIALQAFAIGFLRDSIDAYRRVVPNPLESSS